MKRKLEGILDSWKLNKDKKPLIIKGARQVGKTYSIRKFAKQHYRYMIEINFERDKEYNVLFQTTSNPLDIQTAIELKNLDKELKKENTLLFLDEIQACPQALTTLKFLKEECDYDVIASGSLLGVAIANTSSFPVGYVETVEMKPMDFEEFLFALNMKQSQIQILINAFEKQKPLEDSIHNLFLDYFKKYILCGGMPEVVQKYIQTKSLKEVNQIQKRILNDYINDIAKYADKNDRIKVLECFSSIPLQLAKENKKFQYKIVRDGYNARYYDASLRWLEESGLIIKVNRLKTIKLPLEAYVELPIFKIYMFDTGLLIAHFDEMIVEKIYSGELDIFKGVIYENACAQILKSKDKKIYYYEPSTSTEIDFITYSEGEIVPIEMKAGTHTISKSLNYFVGKNESKLAYRFSIKNLGSKGVIRYNPYYMLPFIR